MARVLLEGIDKKYPNGFQAVHHADIDIQDKEFLILVGPSGCGKSTTLRMIAGLEEISGGSLKIGEKLVNDIPPKDRDIAMVFQDYALYPHMTVYDNMAFGLKIRKMSKKDIDARVKEAAKILHIESLLERKPKMLSGGQRQRVALGRAIVRKPKVFLFDEPLSNLDAKLRVVMRAELSVLHRQLETTMVYVTHDQVEAMTMATRIVVMKDGFIQQIDSPKNLYDKPVNKFVAGFIGSPPMNFIRVLVKNDGGNITVTDGDFTITPTKEQQELLKSYSGKEVYFGLRPEDINLQPKDNNVIKANVKVVEPLGAESILHVVTSKMKISAEGTGIVVRVGPDYILEPESNIELGVTIEKCHFFETDVTTTNTGNKVEKCITAELR